MLAMLLVTPALAQSETTEVEEVIDLGVVVVEAEAIPPPASPALEGVDDPEAATASAEESFAELLADSAAVTVISREQVTAAPSVSDVIATHAALIQDRSQLIACSPLCPWPLPGCRVCANPRAC